MVYIWTDDGDARPIDEYRADVISNLAYLQPDDPAHDEQLHILAELDHQRTAAPEHPAPSIRREFIRAHRWAYGSTIRGAAAAFTHTPDEQIHQLIQLYRTHSRLTAHD